MSVFLWVVIGISVLDVIGRLTHLVTKSGPRIKSRAADGLDIVLNGCLAAWAVYLL